VVEGVERALMGDGEVEVVACAPVFDCDGDCVGDRIS
jgi:hypothetical protein